MVAIMELSQQQLSKQDHYNYGLRSFIIPIARAAGTHYASWIELASHLRFSWWNHFTQAMLYLL